MKINDNSSRLHVAFLVAARLCLIVSLWQAPIPWLHCHGTNLGQLTSIASALELSSHLDTFHHYVKADLDDDLGWHFHWILPCWSHALDDTPDDELPSEVVVAFDQATISPIVSHFSSGPVAAGNVSAFENATPRYIDSGIGALGHYLKPTLWPEPFTWLRC